MYETINSIGRQLNFDAYKPFNGSKVVQHWDNRQDEDIKELTKKQAPQIF
jgi:predicted SnoaL-like aldol condensation-catalyzing enzyme